ncbi:MAG: DUF1146 domain-containing protein [Tenericutes bacterium]|nr:DUF1146 domain-containing protein [Mycoplasmatota bacterium]
MFLSVFDPRIFVISRIILFFVAVVFIFRAMQAIDFSKIFRKNSGEQIRFLYMVIAIILGYLFVDAIVSILVYVDSLL